MSSPETIEAPDGLAGLGISDRELRWITASAWCFVLAGGVFLYFHKPVPGGLLPECSFHEMTGLHCPGCGATRAVHQLLHLRPISAARHNIFFLLWGGIVFWLLIAYTARAWFRLPLWIPPKPKHLEFLFFGLTIVFWILRNLPFPPFSWLAP